MIIEVEAPDGSIIEFPEGTDDATINRVMSENFTAAKPAEKPQSQVLMDQYKVAEAAGDYELADQLLRDATYAATKDGTAPDSVAFNPRTGRMEDMDLRQNKGRVDAIMQGGGQGVSFGTMDEFVGNLYGVAGPGTFDQNRDYALASMRADLDSARKEYPITTTTSEIAGNVLSSVGGMRAMGGTRVGNALAAPAASRTGAVAKTAGIGGGLGAVYGFATGEGGLADRAVNALQGTAIGAGAGAASIPLAWATRQAAAPVIGAVRNLMPKGSEAAAQNAIVKAFTDAGMSADDATRAIRQAADDGQDIFTLADALGVTGQRQLSGAVRSGGSAKQAASEFLERRQAGQGDRISEFVTDQLGAGPKRPGTDIVPWRRQTPDEIAEGVIRAERAASGRPTLTTADQTRSAMQAARGEAANTAYDAARSQAGPVDVRGALAAIDDRIGPMQGSGVRGDGIDARLSSYRSRLASQPGGSRFGDASSVELSDFDRVLGVKQAIQDDIGQAVRAGRNNEARELGKIVSRLDEALEAASDGYRAANDSFRTASREIDQIDRGIAAARPGSRASDTAAEYSALTTEGQRNAYRAGYGDRVLSNVERGAAGSNKARPFTSQKSQTEMAAMGRRPEQFARQIERENTMFGTRNAALGGSQTADNLADMGSTNWLAQRMPTSVMDTVLTGANALGNLAKGTNAATRDMIVSQLLSTGDDAARAIAGAVQRGEKLTRDQRLMLEIYLYTAQSGGNQLAR